MSAPRWLYWLSALVLAASVALTGCTAESGLSSGRTTSPPGSPLATPVPQAAQTVVDELVDDARTGDRAAFDRLVSTRDASFADRARLLFDNLSGLPLGGLQLRLQARPQPVSTSRQQLLGSGAWRQRATVTWRLAGETATAEQAVWLTFVSDQGHVLLAGTLDEPTGTTDPQPIWWTGPVTASRQGSLTVLVGSGQPADQWLARTREAVRDVRRQLTAGPARTWTGAVVVEVPASRADFEAVVGAAPGSYAEVAAVTLAEGPASTSALRIVVNPEVTRTLTEVGVATVLTHEMVHRATRSADSPAPTWVVEGLADYVAFTRYPAAARASRQLVVHQVRQHGAPRSLPADDRFGAQDAELDLTYAEAWSACRYVAATWSAADLQRLYTALDGGLTLNAAAQDALGVSAAALTAGWRRWLERRAR